MLELRFDPFPVLNTERLVLRRITKNDAAALFEMRTDEDIMRFVKRPKPKSHEDILQLVDKIDGMIDRNEAIAWAMTLKGDDRMLGHTSFHVVMKEHHRAEVGYMVHKSIQGRGLMDEALKAMLDYGFGPMGLHSIEAHVSPQNFPSQKVLERNGFRKEAYFKENFLWEGTYFDTIVYCLTASSGG